MFTTWLQARTPQKVMGRVMSLLMIASIGLSPISNAVSGALIKLSLGWGLRRRRRHDGPALHSRRHDEGK